MTTAFLVQATGLVAASLGNNNNNKHAYAGQLNSFAHLEALLVLHDRGIKPESV